jgi:hypothetical protein
MEGTALPFVPTIKKKSWRTDPTSGSDEREKLA